VWKIVSKKRERPVGSGNVHSAMAVLVSKGFLAKTRAEGRMFSYTITESGMKEMLV
jgi:DNA-binding PadR family transcriptional regulator